jgi:surfeit locus 1 family protein
MRRFFALREIAKTLIALILVGLCLIAGNWQWNKGKVLSQQNSIIKSNLTKNELKEADLITVDAQAEQWRNVALHGHFDNNHQLLIRDRYNQGVFGFEVLQLFRTNRANYWIDRGWVKAGATAKTPPSVPSLPEVSINIKARIRSEDLSRQIHGSFFAIPSSAKKLPLANIQGVDARSYYLDELSADIPQAAPLTLIELPDLSNGPHLAYALHWLAFAVLIVIARGMLFRETKRLSLEELEVETA